MVQLFYTSSGVYHIIWNSVTCLYYLYLTGMEYVQDQVLTHTWFINTLHLHQFNLYCHCNATSIVTNGSICVPFRRPNITNHMTQTLQVPWNYNFIPSCHGSIWLHFNIPNRTNHTLRILQVPLDYQFIPRSLGTINLDTNLTFTVTDIQLQLSQMDLYVFSSIDQIELNILQEPSGSPGTIISSQGPMGPLILSPI